MNLKKKPTEEITTVTLFVAWFCGHVSHVHGSLLNSFLFFPATLTVLLSLGLSALPFFSSFPFTFLLVCISSCLIICFKTCGFFFPFWMLPPPSSPLYSAQCSVWEPFSSMCMLQSQGCCITGYLCSFSWVYCQQTQQIAVVSVWEQLLSKFGYSYIRVHQGALISKGSLHSNLLKKHAIVTLLSCPSSEAAANLTWAEKWRFLSFSLSISSLWRMKILFSIIFWSLAFFPHRILLS